MKADIFTGLSAFPLTPLAQGKVDYAAFGALLERLAKAKVDSMGLLGSTGCYAYLSLAERQEILAFARERAGNIPLIAGISALRLRDVLLLAEQAQKAEAAALLLAPWSYQVLNEAEAFALYEAVDRASDLPICLYDNPSTTHFQFSDAFYARLAELKNIASIKILPISPDVAVSRARIAALRAALPPHIKIGISGDASAAAALAGGCDLWYSALGGLFPHICLKITRLIEQGQAEAALRESAGLEILWDLFDRHDGSLRVIAACAELTGAAKTPCLPAPLQSIKGEDRAALARWLRQANLS